MTNEEKNQLMENDILKEPMAIGEVFAKSGLFPDIKSQAQAAVKILAGRELGLSPFESMKNLYLVGGKLAIQSNALASLVKSNKKFNYKVEELTTESCKIRFLERADVPGTVVEVGGKFEPWIDLGVSEYTLKDAAKAGIVNKDNWKNHPKNMLFARALANGVRWFCPNVACGWHTSEEFEDQPVQASTITMSSEGVEVTDGT